MSNTPRIRVVLLLDRNVTGLLIKQAQVCHDGMAARTDLYPAPPVALTALAGLITALANAEALAGHSRAATTARNVARSALCTALEGERAYVQGLVDANPEQGSVLVDSAGMHAARSPAHSKPLLQAKPGSAA